MDGKTGAEEPDRLDRQVSQRRVAATAASADDRCCWRQDFAGEERRLREVRAWLASLLPPCPARDDVLSIATELGANAIRHTTSGHGGSFTVEFSWMPRVVRVAVADGGGLTEPRLTDEPLGEDGRACCWCTAWLSVSAWKVTSTAGGSGPRSPGTAGSLLRRRLCLARPKRPVPTDRRRIRSRGARSA